MWTAARLGAALIGFAVLLFITRFVARAHLIPQTDQECHIGGIAVDVLAHGIRFPLLVYAPNEYDNGSFFSGLLAALSFALLGRSVLALKLVTHVIVAAGAVATLWLLRGCLEELGLMSRRVRWAATTVLVVALALAPRVVTLSSMYAVGNHAEGSAIDTLLLALFASRLHTRSVARTAAFWALVGFALYLNKGTLLVIPVLAAAEMVLAWQAGLCRRLAAAALPNNSSAGVQATRGPFGVPPLGGANWNAGIPLRPPKGGTPNPEPNYWAKPAAAAGGFVVGGLPELLVISQRWGMGWATVASKAERGSQTFPQAFLDSVFTLADYRIELLAVWVLAFVAGGALLVQSIRSGAWRGTPASPFTPGAGAPPVTLAIVMGSSGLHLAMLTVMAQGGRDSYAIYGYPTLVVLVALPVASMCARVAARWGEGALGWVGAAAVVLTLFLYRPDTMTWGFAKVAALWRNRAGAACSWRFAEGFEREHQYSLAPPDRTREQHAIERCRSLTEPAQILDCIGGIARELNWRQGGKVGGEPPSGLSADERRAYAYLYGTHRRGDATACREFANPNLAADCAAAVQLECLVFGDMLTGFASGHSLGRPRCALPAPPMDGYWAEMRRDLLTRTAGTGPNLPRAGGDDDLWACMALFDRCY